MDSMVACERKLVAMGEVRLARRPAELHTVLGSCVGLAIVHLRKQVGVLGHIVLPEAAGRSGPPGKYADQAIPYMLELLRSEGVPLANLTIKMAGGSQMFRSTGPMQIGQANIEAVHKYLQEAGLSVHVQEVGGSDGRRVSVDCSTASMTISRAGRADLVI